MAEHMQIVAAAAGKNVEAQYVEMMVPLYSWGCERKIKKALANLKGIYSVNVDFHQQKVIVWGICDKCDVLSVVKKKRKGARFWDSELDDIHVVNNTIQLQHSHSHSAPSSPHQSSSLPNKSSRRYLAMIKKGRSLSLNLSIIKNQSLNWKSLKKAFARSYSF